jgi:hypothetical protein
LAEFVEQKLSDSCNQIMELIINLALTLRQVVQVEMATLHVKVGNLKIKRGFAWWNKNEKYFFNFHYFINSNVL